VSASLLDHSRALVLVAAGLVFSPALVLAEGTNYGPEGFVATALFKSMKVTVTKGKTNVQDLEDPIPEVVGTRQRVRGITVGWKEKTVLKDTLGYGLLALRPDHPWSPKPPKGEEGKKESDKGKEKQVGLPDLLLWDAVKLDLTVGRERSRQASIDRLGGASREDPEDDSTFRWRVTYQLDVGALACWALRRRDTSQACWK